MTFQQGVTVLVAVGLGCIFGSGGASAATVGLANYVQSGGIVNVGPAVSDDLSGVAYNSDTDTLFTVVNNPEVLVEMGTDGTILRSVTLSGFDDTEGIVHLGGDRYGVVEEGLRNFVTFQLPDGVTSISHSSGVEAVIPIGNPGTASSSANLGLEGLAYDMANDHIYVVWEMSDNPGVTEQEIRRFDLGSASDGVVPAMVDPFPDGALNALGLGDLAGMHFVSTTNTLLILSDESNRVVEVTPTGTQLGGIIDLGDPGDDAFGQPEGVTFGAGGEIYVVGEPDEFAVYVTSSPQIPEPGATLLVMLGGGAALVRRRRH